MKFFDYAPYSRSTQNDTKIIFNSQLSIFNYYKFRVRTTHESPLIGTASHFQFSTLNFQFLMVFPAVGCVGIHHIFVIGPGVTHPARRRLGMALYIGEKLRSARYIEYPPQLLQRIVGYAAQCTGTGLPVRGVELQIYLGIMFMYPLPHGALLYMQARIHEPRSDAVSRIENMFPYKALESKLLPPLFRFGEKT